MRFNAIGAHRLWRRKGLVLVVMSALYVIGVAIGGNSRTTAQTPPYAGQCIGSLNADGLPWGRRPPFKGRNCYPGPVFSCDRAVGSSPSHAHTVYVTSPGQWDFWTCESLPGLNTKIAIYNSSGFDPVHPCDNLLSSGSASNTSVAAFGCNASGACRPNKNASLSWYLGVGVYQVAVFGSNGRRDTGSYKLNYSASVGSGTFACGAISTPTPLPTPTSEPGCPGCRGRADVYTLEGDGGSSANLSLHQL